MRPPFASTPASLEKTSKRDFCRRSSQIKLTGPQGAYMSIAPTGNSATKDARARDKRFAFDSS